MTQICQKGPFFEFYEKMRKSNFFRLQRLGLVQQARGARSLGKFPKYRNKKKSEKQIFYPEKDFPSVKFFHLKTILNESEEKSKNRII